ncbi:adenine nucleotide alpha hydrolase [Flagellimonas myxillae]|uniref:adenine nucleotide alpha hydrolase n=1 Tax=Flagellimonas myxillae TaxID=2942214 RepID=UPI00201F2BC1|nr:adenine nucleotide alpha hydrolase [Muricauda myxillae]MCL6267015.1 adenine nucleotide alpha hydrolase [Muricauda myxillae]
MSQKAKTFFNWSSGKDSALALYHLQQGKQFQIDTLLTTVNAHYNRVSMHGLRREVLEAQTKSIGIPLEIVEVPEKPSMETYNELMATKMQQMVSKGHTHAAFGDIFLEDLKAYREKMLATQGIKTVFPIWKKDTKELFLEFLNLGFKSKIICINNSKLDEAFLGAELSPELLKEFPSDVDPCGENGEFHTFCHNGPIFDHPIPIVTGKKVFKTYDDPSSASGNIQFGFLDVQLKRIID